MASIIPARPRSQMQRRTVAVVASQYHPAYIQGLVTHFRQELDALSPATSVRVFEVPGAFEIPVVVQEVAAQGGFDAVIAFGVLLAGETLHAQLIGTAVTNALMDCSLRYRLPVIHEVLVVADEAQAEARCLQPELNRGTEAARAAVSIITTLSSFKTH